jgi:hypothetical protein
VAQVVQCLSSKREALHKNKRSFKTKDNISAHKTEDRFTDYVYFVIKLYNIYSRVLLKSHLIDEAFNGRTI